MRWYRSRCSVPSLPVKNRKIIPNGLLFPWYLTRHKRWEGAAHRRNDSALWKLADVPMAAGYYPARTPVREGPDGSAVCSAAPVGSGADRAVRGAGAAGVWVDGPGVPGAFGGRAAGGGQDDPAGASGGSRVPDPVRPGSGGGAEGQRGLHCGGGRRRSRGGPALAGDRVRAGAVAGAAGAGVRAAAGELGAVAGGGVRGGAGLDSRGGPGAPGPEAVERAGGAGRAAGDRLRGGPGGRADGPDDVAGGGGDAGVHGAGASP